MTDIVPEFKKKNASRKKPIYGVGINDAWYPTTIREELPKGPNGERRRKVVWVCPFYQCWKHLVERCYSESFLKKWHSYRACTMDESWLTFSVFRKWMETQDWEGNHLDKDLFVRGNKHYSPEFCVFLPPNVNTFMVDGGIGRGEHPIGVSYSKKAASCSNQFLPKGKRNEIIGWSKDPIVCHNMWKAKKHEHACRLADQQSDPRVAEALRKRYAPDTNWLEA